MAEASRRVPPVAKKAITTATAAARETGRASARLGPRSAKVAATHSTPRAGTAARDTNGDARPVEITASSAATPPARDAAAASGTARRFAGMSARPTSPSTASKTGATPN